MFRFIRGPLEQQSWFISEEERQNFRRLFRSLSLLLFCWCFGPLTPWTSKNNHKFSNSIPDDSRFPVSYSECAPVPPSVQPTSRVKSLPPLQTNTRRRVYVYNTDIRAFNSLKMGSTFCPEHGRTWDDYTRSTPVRKDRDIYGRGFFSNPSQVERTYSFLRRQTFPPFSSRSPSLPWESYPLSCNLPLRFMNPTRH